MPPPQAVWWAILKQKVFVAPAVALFACACSDGGAPELPFGPMATAPRVAISQLSQGSELVDGSVIAEGPTPPWLIRAANARVDVSVFEIADVVRVRFRPFPDVDTMLTLTRVERTATGWVWVGEAEGAWPDSTVLVVADDFVSGNVRRDGLIWHIRPADLPVHVIEEIDPATFPGIAHLP